MKLNVKALALTSAIVCGGGLFILTWWVILFNGASGERTVIGLVYPGYNISPLGSIIGLGYAFVDGLIGGAVFGWIYNLIAKPVAKE